MTAVTPPDRSLLLLQLDYTAWATGRLLEAGANLSDEELNRDLMASHGGVLNTLRHIFYADRVWLSRFRGAPVAFQGPGPEPTLAELQDVWPTLLGEFKEFVGELPAEEMSADLHYKNLKGQPFSAARWKILLHVVNHGTLHRGQIMAMLRQLGHQPPATDLIYFYLSR